MKINSLPQKGRTQKTSLMLLSFLVVAFLFLPLVSAVWWNPFSWFQGEETTIIKQGSWVQTFNDNPDLYAVIPDKTKHDADIYLCSKTLTKKNQLPDLDFATSEKTKEKELKTKAKLKPIKYGDAYCYYYKPTKDEKFLKFDKHSTHFVYTNESITATEDDIEIGKLSLITEGFEYKNGKPNIETGRGKDKLTHTFYIEKYSSESITNLKTIDMKNGLEVERNSHLKYLTYVEEPTYDTVCEEVINETNTTTICEQVINGTSLTKEQWSNMSYAIEGEDYIIGVFSDVLKNDYVDIDFDYYGVSVLESPIDWATWSEDLNTDLEAYWNMDETSGDAEDISGNEKTLIEQGTVANIPSGIIESARGTFSTSNYLIDTNVMNFDGSQDFTLSYWGYWDETSSDFQRVVAVGSGTAGYFNCHFQTTSTSTHRVRCGKLGDPYSVDIGYTFPANQWVHHLITFTASSNVVELFINDVSIGTDTYTSSGESTGTAVSVGSQLGFEGATNIDVDEVSLWSRVLTGDEIEDLYNGGDGLPFNSGTPPSVTLISPADEAELTSANVDMTATVTDDQYVENVTLYLDGVANETKTTHVNGSYTFSKTVSEGVHIWSILAYDNDSLSNQSANWSFNYTQPPVFVELLSPDAGITSNNYTINMSCWGYKDTGVTGLNMTIDGVLNQSITNSTPEENLTISTLLDFSDGTHNWSCSVTNGLSSATSSTRSFTIDTTPFIEFLTPPTLVNYANSSLNYIPIKVNVSTLYFENITYSLRDVNGTNYTQFYTNETYDINFTDTPTAHYHYDVTVCALTGECNVTEARHINHDFEEPIINGTAPVSPTNYLRAGDNITVNFTVDDTNLDSCIVQSDGVNYTLPVCLNSTNNSISVPFNGDSWVLIYANDSLGNLAYQNYTWVTKVTELNQTFDVTARSGDVAAYYIYLWVHSDYDIDASNFLFDGEVETPSLFSFGENKTLFVPDFIVPGYPAETNVSFTWNITLDDSTQVDIINKTQLITTINLDNCSNFTNQLFNFTLLDERSQSSISGDIEVFFQLINNLNFGEINSYNILLENVTNGLICSSTDLFGQSVLYNSEVRYWADDRETELYYLQRSQIEDGGTNVSLYDLDTNHSTEFKITYQDSNFNFVDDAVVQLQRKYIAEDSYKTVEAPKTSDAGVVITHIDLDSVVYRATVVKNGEVLNVFDNPVFSCESELTGECTHKLLGSIDPQNEINYDDERDFAYTVSSDNDSVSISFTIPSSSPSSINMQLKQIDQFGNETLCNETLTSSAGLIECGYNATIGDSYLELKLFKNGEPIEVKGYVVPEAGGVDFLQNNFLIAVILILTLVGMALTSPEWIIVNGIVSLVIAGALWLVNGLNFAMGLGLIMWLVIAAGIIISKLAKQEDK